MGKMRHNYKNLKIWQAGLELSKKVSDVLETFPKHERYDLTSQMSRCSISIPSNVSEGSARSNKAFSNHLDIALGSSFELGTQLLIAAHKNYINNTILEELESSIAEWQKMTMSFQNSLNT